MSSVSYSVVIRRDWTKQLAECKSPSFLLPQLSRGSFTSQGHSSGLSYWFKDTGVEDSEWKLGTVRGVL